MTPESPSIGEDVDMHAATAPIVGLAPETTYHYRMVATNADGEATGPAGTFTTKEPLDFGPIWTTEVGTEAAILNAELNPLGIPATGFFEYVTQAEFEASGFANAVATPATPFDFGAGEAMKPASAPITGLAPATTYRYRLRASNPFTVPARTSPERTFTTYAPLSGDPVLPDGRGYEQVSPLDKMSGEVGTPAAAAGLTDGTSPLINRAAPDGETFTFTSFAAFADAKAAPGASQYLARRSAAGWTTENITPPDRGNNFLHPTFRGFSEDLGFGYEVTREPVLAPGATPGIENLYRRESQGGGQVTMTAAVPQVPGVHQYCVGFAGASRMARACSSSPVESSPPTLPWRPN